MNIEIGFDEFFTKRHGELPADTTSDKYADMSYLKHEMKKSWDMATAQLEGCVAPVWVATDFQLPDEGELVLFLDNHNVIHEGFISTDYVDGPYGENGEDLGSSETLWSSNSNGWELLPDQVKYWMKRPNNPIEAARGGK